MAVHPYTRLFIQASAPTVDDDESLGYEQGDTWITSTGIYQCRDAADGVAVWVEAGGASFDLAAAIVGADEKTTIAYADKWPMADSEDSDTLKYVDWTTILNAIVFYMGDDYLLPPSVGIDEFLLADGTGGWYVGEPSDAREAIGVREKLTANRTYYVRTDGNDSNDGLTDTAGGAFLTIQKAVDTVASIDISIYDVTIQIGNGTYAEEVICKQCVGAGMVYILGDTTTPSNVVISGATTFDAYAISTVYNVQGVKGTGSVSFIRSQIGALVEFGNVHIANTGHQLRAVDSGLIRCVADYTITAGGTTHMVSAANGLIRVQGFTVTLTGTPAFSVQFAQAGSAGIIIANGNTYSGAATGTRYLASTNGTIFVAGAASTYFPGNVAGSVATGGVYA